MFLFFSLFVCCLCSGLLEKALDLLTFDAISLHVETESNRKVFLVKPSLSSSSPFPYIVFPNHYCSCRAFHDNMKKFRQTCDYQMVFC